MDILTQDFWNKQVNLNVCWTDSDKFLLESISKLIDLDATVERLQDFNCQNCLAFTDEQVKFAFLKWFESTIESIEQQPEWYIKNEPKVFNQNLPFDKLDELMYSDDLREYDPEEYYAQIDAEHRASELTPEEIAISAIYDW
jgi:hypothetical protein